MRRTLLRMVIPVLLLPPSLAQQPSFTLPQILSAPFLSNVVASKTGDRLAWSENQQGRRNIWVAEGPGFTPRKVTDYTVDDGEELSGLQFTPDGSSIVYVRGVEKNSSGEFANPTSNPAGPEQTIWVMPFGGGAPRKIDVGQSPCVSAKNRLAFARGGQIVSSRSGWRGHRETGTGRGAGEERAGRMVAGRNAVAVCERPSRSQFHRNL